ncbi:MAG: hypothetical protein WC205_09415 [Opitutaceae bacterium]|jgi:hypothetical protein
MKIPAILIACYFGFTAIAVSLHADVLTLQFDGGKVTSVVDGFNGMVGSGWATAWAGSGSIGSRTITVENSDPLVSGGDNYFKMVSTSTGSSQSSFVQRRVVNDSVTGIDFNSDYTISFSTRIEDITGGGVYFFGDNTSGLAGISSSNAWRISALKDGQWTVGIGAGAQQLGMSLVTGVTYSISLQIDPLAKTYLVTIGNGVTSVSSTAIAYGSTSTGGEFLYFGAQGLNNTQSVTFDLDAINVASVSNIPEPASLAAYVGVFAIAVCVGIRCRRR